MTLFKNILAPLVSLIASTAALISGAIPTIFEASGYGEQFADFAARHTQLLWLSKLKFELFMAAGAFIFLVSLLHFRSRSKIGAVLYILSLLILLTAAFYAFIAPEYFLKDHP
jgi:amino acid transporter